MQRWRSLRLGLATLAIVSQGPLGTPLSAQTAGHDTVARLFSPRIDLNGLLLNPTWKAGGTLDVERQCGFRGGPGVPGYRVLVLRDSTCLETPETPLRLVEPRAVRAFGVACQQGNEEGLIRGHVNWNVVTMTGTVDWLGMSSDGDYNFALWPDTAVALTSGNGGGRIEVEFNAYETAARMDTLQRGRAWTRLWRLAHHTSDDSTAFQGLPGIVTGLFGVDGIHGAPVELHPVYALFLKERTHSSPGEVRERWMFMVRNLGDEGMCSHGQIPLRLGHASDTIMWYRALIHGPADADSVRLVWTPARSWVAATSSAAQGPYFITETHHEVQVAVRLPVPRRDQQDALVYGEFELLWKVPSTRSVVAMRAPVARRRLREFKRERHPEDRVKPGLASIGQCSSTSMENEIGTVRTHWRSCVMERQGAPAHDTVIAIGPVTRAARREQRATEVWADAPDVIVCGDQRLRGDPLCHRVHHMAAAAGFLASPSGPRVSSIMVSPIEYQPGGWLRPLGVISDILGLRPAMLSLDWYSSVDTLGQTRTTFIGSIAPALYFPFRLPKFLLGVPIRLAGGPTLSVRDRAMPVYLGAFGSVGARAAFTQVTALTIDLRWMREGGQGTWAVLLGGYTLAPW